MQSPGAIMATSHQPPMPSHRYAPLQIDNDYEDVDWYCVHTKHQKESTVVARLTYQGFRTFFPTFINTLLDKRRQRILHRPTPMFPCYLFVAFNVRSDLWQPIVSTIGVRKLFSYSPDRPVKVPRRTIDSLRAQMDAQHSSVPHTGDIITAGTAFLITKGNFAGSRGICSLPGTTRSRLLLEIMGGRVEVEFANTHLAAIPV